MLFRRYDSPVKQLEYRILLHGDMHFAAPVGKTIEPVTFGLQLDKQGTHALHLANHKISISVAELPYFLLVLRHRLLHLIDYLLERTLFAIETFIPLFRHQMTVEIFRLLAGGEYLVKNDEIIIVHKHLAKIKNQVLYHI